ncbi:MAG: glutaredoxin family protein [Planctomycetota bacterium]
MVKLKDGAEVDLELFKFDACPFCRRVQQAIERLGVEGIRYRDTMKEAGANEELVRRGGMRQVPCLFIDGRAMYESAEIVRWLEEHVAAG